MFQKIFEQYSWQSVQESIYGKTSADVERALYSKKRTLEDFKSLVSPAALPYLEQMAQISHAITQKRFGKTIQMYIPLYLSNECQNICTYCAFSHDNKIPRRTLTIPEIIREVNHIKQMNYEHVLLVTGEANHIVDVPYFIEVLEHIRPFFAHIAMEVQPLSQEDYQKLIDKGLQSVLVYQETYNKSRYAVYHPKGKKSNFEYRLATPDRLGKAGIQKIGLGVLIGLEDWRVDSFFTALHLKYLEKTYWKTKYSISFPRLRPIEIEQNGELTHKNFEYFMKDRELVQLICAYRLLDEQVELSLSTRESEKFRNNVIPLGITSMSAGSKTNPGGYTTDLQTLEQFEISDERSPEQMAYIIAQKGYEAVWKDADKHL